MIVDILLLYKGNISYRIQWFILFIPYIISIKISFIMIAFIHSILVLKGNDNNEYLQWQYCLSEYL